MVCPGCAFTFDADHTDQDGGGYTCPACDEARTSEVLLGLIRRELGHDWADSAYMGGGGALAYAELLVRELGQ